MKRVVAFGSFDPLHDGHINFFKQARKLGEHLIVVVAKDKAIRQLKQYDAHENEDLRRQKVAKCESVSKAILGDDDPSTYNLLEEMDFDVLALGYDQKPQDQDVEQLLRRLGKDKISIVRLVAFEPNKFKSSKMRNQLYDMHLHSAYSDGDLSVKEVVEAVAKSGLGGMSLTDHNGIWGCKEARQWCDKFGLEFMEGIEISAKSEGVDVHVLGYSRNFRQGRLQSGLEKTLIGYKERAQKMIAKCQEAGYEKINWETLRKARQNQDNACYLSYDVARMLHSLYGLSVEEARKLTVTGGACHIPYGDWAMTPEEAVKLIVKCRGIAVLAHPGTIKKEADEETMWKVAENCLQAGVSGLEVNHPFHSKELSVALTDWAIENGLMIIGGSDWHGPGRYDDQALGSYGVKSDDWRSVLSLTATL